jgi:hypothetical protein
VTEGDTTLFSQWKSFTTFSLSAVKQISILGDVIKDVGRSYKIETSDKTVGDGASIHSWENFQWYTKQTDHFSRSKDKNIKSIN